jgi:hypothetical protein
MKKLQKASQILILRPTKEDLITGAKYSAITLPWTFNRMMMNTESSGQQKRGLNIAKGIVGQEMLKRALSERGVKAEVQRKSHRDEDLFDFHVFTSRGLLKLDVKSFNYYTDYADVGREPLTPKLLIKNADYPGPDWRRFFPMLVPHTQIGQAKEAYCFAIATSIDFRQDIHTNRIGYALTAFPYGSSMPFMCSKKLCQAREDAGKGFYITCKYIVEDLLDGFKISFTIIGEWQGKLNKIKISIGKNAAIKDIGPFSCIDSFQIGRSDHEKFYGHMEISISKNEYDDPVLNSARININVVPNEALTIELSDFCNLMLPEDYTLYVLGWITKDAFLKKSREYTGWVWPNDGENKFENQPWTQITENDRNLLSRLGCEGCIQEKPTLVDVGLMKTHGRGGGACCYVFPNIGRNGGVKETNLYVLPKDLYIIDELGK